MKSSKLFEIGKIYFEEAGQPREETQLGMVATGNSEEKSVHSASRAINFFDIKGEIEMLFGPSWNHIGLAGAADNSRVPKYYHPGLSVQLVAEATSDIGAF